MVNIIFQDSFEGFLSALFYAFKNDIKNPLFLKAQKPSLFKSIKVEEDENILKEARRLLEEEVLELFYDCFCFDDEKAFSDVYKSFLFYIKNRHLKDIHQDFIRNLVYYRKSVSRERHKYIGFLRFQNVEDILYAKFEPKHLVLDYLGEFFKRRYPKENFIIHDVKRKKAAIYYDGYLSIEPFDKEINIEHDEYQKLWKAFFEAVSIKERANKRLQDHYVPHYFRKHMIEFHH